MRFRQLNLPKKNTFPFSRIRHLFESFDFYTMFIWVKKRVCVCKGSRKIRVYSVNIGGFPGGEEHRGSDERATSPLLGFDNYGGNLTRAFHMESSMVNGYMESKFHGTMGHQNPTTSGLSCGAIDL